MKTIDAVSALAALAQENRLEIYRLLVSAGPGGLPAGEIAEEKGLSPNNLTFHLDKLKEAGLVSVQRKGRLMIYSARYSVMHALVDYLTRNCCTRSRSK